MLRLGCGFFSQKKSKYNLSENEALIKEIYPNVNIVDIPDSGHWLHAEQLK